MTDEIRCPKCNAPCSGKDPFCSRCGAALVDAPSSVSSETTSAGEGVDEELTALLAEALAPNFLVIRKLGQGGMASVYLAREPTLKRLVAVKVLAPELAADRNARARFQREAQAAASISHPNIVSVYSVGELSDGTPYFIMQYVSGESISERLEREGPLDVAEATRIMGEVASALAAAHKRGIIHRDIKPSNVLYDEEWGRILVSDFGIAAVRKEGESDDATKLTQTGAAIGTPHYMSPEQLLGEEVTDRTDIYALGLFGYEVLTGRGPFQVSSPQEIVAAHLRDEPEALTKLREDIDPELERLIQRCLSKDAAARPAASDISRRFMPGAGVLLEWPPPGLEVIHGKVWMLSGVLALGALLFVVPFLYVLSGVASDRGILPAWFYIFGTALGVIPLIISARFAVGLGIRVTRALGMGFAWLTVLEVLADRRGDTGALISGTREYSVLDVSDRSKARKIRVAVGLAVLAAAMAPLVMLHLYLRLGSSGILGPAVALEAVIAPSAILLLAALWVSVRNDHAVRDMRKRLKQRRVLATKSPKLIPAWYESFEAARRGQPLGRGAPGRKFLGWAFGVFLTLLVIGGVLIVSPLIVISMSGSAAFQALLPEFEGMVEKRRYAELGRRYQLPPNPTVTALEAGRSYYALSMAGYTSTEAPYEHPVPRRLRGEWFPDDNPFGKYPPNLDDLMSMAVEGFNAEQTEYLARLAAHPGHQEIGVIARAVEMDALGARLKIPFSESQFWLSLAVQRFAGLKEAAYAHLAKAAMELSRGRVEDAETTLRETVSFGLLLGDDGPFLIEALIGFVITGIGRGGLEAFYRATGREKELSELTTARDSVDALREALAVETARMSSIFDVRNPREVRRTINALVMDSTALRSLRWELFGNLAFAPCTNVRELVFGPSSEHLDVVARVRESLVRYPSEAALFDLMEDTPNRMAGPSKKFLPNRLYRLGRTVGLLLGNPRLEGCTAVARFWDLS